MEDIIDAAYMQAKRVQKDFKIKKLDEYRYFYVQSNSLLPADVFSNFRNMCFKTNEINPACFLSTQVLAWKPVLKNTKAKLDLLTDTDILLVA